MTDHHGKTTTGSAVNVRPSTNAKHCHGTNYCAIAQVAVNRDKVTYTCMIVKYKYLVALNKLSMLSVYVCIYVKDIYEHICIGAADMCVEFKRILPQLRAVLIESNFLRRFAIFARKLPTWPEPKCRVEFAFLSIVFIFRKLRSLRNIHK